MSKRNNLYSMSSNYIGDVENIYGTVNGNIKGNVYGCIRGDVNGDIDGNVYGKIFGTVRGNIKGSVRKDYIIGLVFGEISDLLISSDMKSTEDTSGVEKEEEEHLITCHCIICLDTIKELINKKTHLMTSVCGHFFCQKCLHEMLLTLNSDYPCPICRKILNESEFIRIYF